MMANHTIDQESFREVADVIWAHNPKSRLWAKGTKDIVEQMLKYTKGDLWTDSTILFATGGYEIARFRMPDGRPHYRAFVATHLWDLR